MKLTKPRRRGREPRAREAPADGAGQRRDRDPWHPLESRPQRDQHVDEEAVADEGERVVERDGDEIDDRVPERRGGDGGGPGQRLGIGRQQRSDDRGGDDDACRRQVGVHPPEGAFRAALGLLLGERPAQPVQHHRHQHHGDSVLQRLPQAQALKPEQQVLAEPLGADEGGDHDHRQALHDDLVDPQHERVARRRNLHLEEHLPSRAAGHAAGLAYFLGDPLETQDREPRHRRNGEQNGGDGPCPVRDADEERDRDQVREMRQRLHDVQDRPERPLERGPLDRHDAQCDADGGSDGRRNQDDGERRHRQRPLAEQGEVDDAAAGKQREPPALQPPAEDRGKARDHHPRDGWNADRPEALGKQAVDDIERPLYPECDRPRRVLDREDAEDLVLVEDVDDDVDPVDEGNRYRLRPDDAGLRKHGLEREQRDEGRQDEKRTHPRQEQKAACGRNRSRDRSPACPDVSHDVMSGRRTSRRRGGSGRARRLSRPSRRRQPPGAPPRSLAGLRPPVWHPP